MGMKNASQDDITVYDVLEYISHSVVGISQSYLWNLTQYLNFLARRVETRGKILLERSKLSNTLLRSAMFKFRKSKAGHARKKVEWVPNWIPAWKCIRNGEMGANLLSI
jgi:hypothetical protein